MANSINRLTIGGNTGVFALPFTTCTSSASDSTKKVSIVGFPSALETGMVIVVEFSSANTASNPTLQVSTQVNNQTVTLTAKSICQYGATVVGNTVETSWQAGAVIPLIFDGTNWITASPLNSTIIDDGQLAGIVQTGTSTWVATFANGQEVLIDGTPTGVTLSSDKDLCVAYCGDAYGFNELYLGFINDGENELELYNVEGYATQSSDQYTTLVNSGTYIGSIKWENSTWSIV